MAWSSAGSARIEPTSVDSVWRFTDAAGYSACGWAYPTTLNNTFRPALAKSSTGDATKCMFIGVMGSGIANITSNGFGFLGNGTNSWGISTTALSTNTWYFWVASHIGTTNPDNALLWVWGPSGLLTTSRKGTTGGIDTDTSMTLWIGQDFGNNALAWIGRLSNLALWNCPMTFAEAAALAGGALPNTIRPRNLLMWATLEGINTTMVNRGLIGGRLKGNGTFSFAEGPPRSSIRDYSLKNYYDPDLPFMSGQPRSRILTPFVGLPSVTVGAAKFRTTLSRLGSRGGSRQVHRV